MKGENGYVDMARRWRCNLGHCRTEYRVSRENEGIGTTVSPISWRKLGQRGCIRRAMLKSTHESITEEDTQMNKRDLIQKTADKTGFTKKECEAVLNALFETITETIESGEKVQIIGFGTFESRERAARTARNPRTGEMVTVPARRMPAFKPGADLKQAVVQA